MTPHAAPTVDILSPGPWRAAPAFAPHAPMADGALVALAAPDTALRRAGGRIAAAAVAAGFGPIAALFRRCPKLALGFCLPILVLTAIGLGRGDLLATVLGLYALGVGAIFANAGAHELMRDAAPAPTPDHGATR